MALIGARFTRMRPLAVLALSVFLLHACTSLKAYPDRSGDAGAERVSMH